MSNEVKINKFFPIPVEKIFKYFVEPNLLEKWAYPEGMGLKVTQFEAKVGGRYRFEHTASNGLYVGTGYIKEIIPFKRLVQVDELITGPGEKKLFENLESTLEFGSQFDGTEVILVQTGFTSEESARECYDAWIQSFHHLTNLIIKDRGEAKPKAA